MKIALSLVIDPGGYKIFEAWEKVEGERSHSVTVSEF